MVCVLLFEAIIGWTSIYTRHPQTGWAHKVLEHFLAGARHVTAMSEPARVTSELIISYKQYVDKFKHIWRRAAEIND